MVTVFANGPGDQDSIPGRVIPKTKKWYLMPLGLSLSIIRYGSMVSRTTKRKEWRPLLHLGGVAFEKGGLVGCFVLRRINAFRVI